MLLSREPLERRRVPRREVDYLVVFAPREGATSEQRATVGRTTDVSANGVQLESIVDLAVGDVVELDIAVDERIVRAQGEVVHGHPRSAGIHASGIRFRLIDTKDRSKLAQQL